MSIFDLVFTTFSVSEIVYISSGEIGILFPDHIERFKPLVTSQCCFKRLSPSNTPTERPNKFLF